jgi:hypothetical protein
MINLPVRPPPPMTAIFVVFFIIFSNSFYINYRSIALHLIGTGPSSMEICLKCYKDFLISKDKKCVDANKEHSI